MARIMVVDDEEPIRAAMAAVLCRAGHRVTVAEDGEAALAKFGLDLFDLVITDIVMPRMDGIETVRALRHRQPGLRIIAISGSDGADGGLYLKAATALGANATLPKPFGAAELRQAVETLLTAPHSAGDIFWYSQPERRKA